MSPRMAERDEPRPLGRFSDVIGWTGGDHVNCWHRLSLWCGNDGKSAPKSRRAVGTFIGLASFVILLLSSVCCSMWQRKRARDSSTTGEKRPRSSSSSLERRRNVWWIHQAYGKWLVKKETSKLSTRQWKRWLDWPINSSCRRVQPPCQILCLYLLLSRPLFSV